MRQYNGGEYTEGRFRGFVISILRSGMRKWPPKWQALNKALSSNKVNVKTGRKANHYCCAACKKEFVLKDVEVDHRQPVVATVGFKDYDTYIDRLYCEASNLQVLCKGCHKKKTAADRVKRKEHNDKASVGDSECGSPVDKDGPSVKPKGTRGRKPKAD